MVWLHTLCNIWHIKARQIDKLLSKSFCLYLSHLDVVGFKKNRAEEREKGSQKATEKKLWGLYLERCFSRSDKTDKAPSARAKRIPQTPSNQTLASPKWILKELICYKKDWEKLRRSWKWTFVRQWWQREWWRRQRWKRKQQWWGEWKWLHWLWW